MSTLDPDVVRALERYSTPTVLNGLKRLGVAPADLCSLQRHSVQCTSPELGPRAGIAVTRVVSTSRSGPAPDPERIAELDRRSAATAAAIAAPKFAVVQNIGDWPGPVCIWGDVQAHIHLAAGYRAGVTNGPVRDVEEMRAAGFQTFAGGVDVGGGFIDQVSVDVEVTLGGVVIAPGDLLHGDRHGVVKVPGELAAELPAAIAAHEEVEARVIAACRAGDFGPDAVRRAWIGTEQRS